MELYKILSSVIFCLVSNTNPELLAHSQNSNLILSISTSNLSIIFRVQILAMVAMDTEHTSIQYLCGLCTRNTAPRIEVHYWQQLQSRPYLDEDNYKMSLQNFNKYKIT